MKKIKKIFAILLIALALTPASSANQIVLDRLSSSEEEKLDIEILFKTNLQKQICATRVI